MSASYTFPDDPDALLAYLNTYATDLVAQLVEHKQKVSLLIGLSVTSNETAEPLLQYLPHLMGMLADHVAFRTQLTEHIKHCLDMLDGGKALAKKDKATLQAELKTWLAIRNTHINVIIPMIDSFYTEVATPLTVYLDFIVAQ